MDRERSKAACAVFEEKIVICGGEDHARALHSVVSFDVSTGTFRPMPGTNYDRLSLVVAGGKLIVIDNVGEGCEVLDGARNRFVMTTELFESESGRADCE